MSIPYGLKKTKWYLHENRGGMMGFNSVQNLNAVRLGVEELPFFLKDQGVNLFERVCYLEELQHGQGVCFNDKSGQRLSIRPARDDTRMFRVELVKTLC